MKKFTVKEIVDYFHNELTIIVYKPCNSCGCLQKVDTICSYDLLVDRVSICNTELTLYCLGGEYGKN